MTTLTLKERFEQDGFIVLRNLLSANEIEHYKELLALHAPTDRRKWTLPDGLVQKEGFWPLIFNQKLLETVRTLFGPDTRFLQHNDLHVGFSSFTWHRDSVNRKFGIGPDWQEEVEPYQLARVGLYLQKADSGFRLGMIKGSQRPDKWLNEEEQKALKRRTSPIANAFTAMSGRDLLSDCAEWISTRPGDAVIFDPRIFHTGSEFSGTKYSTFMAFGKENGHFHRHYHYYRHMRKDLGYSDFPPALVERLEAANLYMQNAPKQMKPIKGAWMPSGIFNAVAKQFK